MRTERYEIVPARVQRGTNPERIEWGWRVKGVNGRIIGASSETFADKRNALANLEREQRVALSEDRTLAMGYDAEGGWFGRDVVVLDELHQALKDGMQEDRRAGR